MNAYELLYFINPTSDDNERTAVNERVVSSITGVEGTIDSIDEWGKRKLAYEIRDLNEGEYYLVNFQANPESIAEIDRLLRITDQVIRFMIVRREVEE